MNFLAHLFLSHHDDELLIGNFIADAVRNRDVATYTQGIQDGIHLHRQIDTFMDNHTLVNTGKVRLRSLYRKYASVVIDVYYDYLLANNWSQFSKLPLEEFAQNTYSVLKEYKDVLPSRQASALPGMIAADWLSNYRNETGLLKAFYNLQHRASKKQWLENPLEGLKRDKELLQNEFLVFFPEIMMFVEKAY